ncbi:ArsR/SmtB family transcription factor [Tindallia californiensis]|uniref:DNA-binding transcriptional regulator, ArsR family n=1 Tax=Tindallia californiensis TaxID=159292 RepID=A0A1H3PQW0_9FIRM|nr:DNA-binding transcriptional regulator, ArsR family [Tindallia californiensis]
MIEKGEIAIDKLANLFKIFCDVNRLKIFLSLKESPKSVSQIINDTGLSQPLVSFHIKVLRQANVIQSRREGTFVFNELTHPELVSYIESFSEFAEGKIITEDLFTGPNCKPLWLKKD